MAGESSPKTVRLVTETEITQFFRRGRQKNPYALFGNRNRDYPIFQEGKTKKPVTETETNQKKKRHESISLLVEVFCFYTFKNLGVFGFGFWEMVFIPSKIWVFSVSVSGDEFPPRQ